MLTSCRCRKLFDPKNSAFLVLSGCHQYRAQLVWADCRGHCMRNSLLSMYVNQKPQLKMCHINFHFVEKLR